VKYITLCKHKKIAFSIKFSSVLSVQSLFSLCLAYPVSLAQPFSIGIRSGL